jgi:ribose transport system substrate-binding protein
MDKQITCPELNINLARLKNACWSPRGNAAPAFASNPPFTCTLSPGAPNGNAMAKLKFLLSLPTDDNDFQQEQAAAAKETAQRLDFQLDIVHADNDAIKQSDQILKAIQAAPQNRPQGILFEPLGATSLPQVARAASGAGIAWVILNRFAEYLPELRRANRAPAFCVSSDHLEIGRIQGMQFAALLPQGGSILYIQGPSENSAAKDRTIGMQETKPLNIRVNMLKAQWTEDSAYKAVLSWMRLPTSAKQAVDLVAAQDDSMAMGARKAMQERPDAEGREKWLRLPFTGCDGLVNSGQKAVRSGTLTATVVVPPNTQPALEMLVAALEQGKSSLEQVLTVPSSFPSLADLMRQGAKRNR